MIRTAVRRASHRAPLSAKLRAILKTFQTLRMPKHARSRVRCRRAPCCRSERQRRRQIATRRFERRCWRSHQPSPPSPPDEPWLLHFSLSVGLVLVGTAAAFCVARWVARHARPLARIMFEAVAWAISHREWSACPASNPPRVPRLQPSFCKLAADTRAFLMCRPPSTRTPRKRAEERPASRRCSDQPAAA